MKNHSKIFFEIDHVDPLGQGVSKKNDKVTFIPKTLPGEVGMASITKKNKKVQFGYLESIEDISLRSPRRIVPECPHFHECQSCHFLHTDYENEIELKRKSLEHFLQMTLKKNPKLLPSPPPLKILKALHRGSYRNRIQLHYDFESKKLGFINSQLDKIVEVPHCLLPQASIQVALKELYDQFHLGPMGNWPQKEVPYGHVELSLQKEDGKVVTSWNRPYAEAGFSQVNSEMNEVLKQEIAEIFRKTFKGKGIVLDLFGGNGNLSASFEKGPVWVVDSNVSKSTLSPHQSALDLDLYHESALRVLEKKLKGEKVEFLLLDPPRSGQKMLSSFVERFHPDHLLYVSCNPHTLFRDLWEIKEGYEIHEVMMIDMFPSTYHYETLIHLKHK